MSDAERISLLRKLLDPTPDRDLGYRLAGVLVPIFGVPFNRIRRLAVEDIHDDGTDTNVRFTDLPTVVPPAVSSMIRADAANRRNLATAANPQSPWMFPGQRPGRPITLDYLMSRTRELGIHLRGGRNAPSATSYSPCQSPSSRRGWQRFGDGRRGGSTDGRLAVTMTPLANYARTVRRRCWCETSVVHLRLGYMASGAGSSAQGIHEAALTGELDVVSAVLIGNNSQSGALDWARDSGIPAYHLSSRTHPSAPELDAAVRDALVNHGVDLVVLSGYAKRVGPLTIAAFDGRMLNVHPAPLPEFGGQGMYGMAVHRAVLCSGRQESAVTIHQVNDHYDEGAIVASYPIPIRRDDNAEVLRERAHDAEPDCWIDVLRRVTNGELLPDARAT